MKFEINDGGSNFKPFILKIEVETREDLIELWHRFNIGELSLNDTYSGRYNKRSDGKILNGNLDIWNQLDERMNNEV